MEFWLRAVENDASAIEQFKQVWSLNLQWFLRYHDNNLNVWNFISWPLWPLTFDLRAPKSNQIVFLWWYTLSLSLKFKSPVVLEILWYGDTYYH